MKALRWVLAALAVLLGLAALALVLGWLGVQGDRMGGAVACATLALADVAILQLLNEAFRKREYESTRARMLLGRAILAGRSINAAIELSEGLPALYSWAIACTQSVSMDPLEGRLLAVLEIGSEADADTTSFCRGAFDEFVIAVDIMNCAVAGHYGKNLDHLIGKKDDEIQKIATTHLRNAAGFLAALVVKEGEDSGSVPTS